MDTVYIDGQNIQTTWGLHPLIDKFYEDLMKYPDIKKRVTSDYDDQDGTNVYYSAGKLKEKEITLTFGVDTYDHYLAFLDYMVAHPLFELTDLNPIDKGIFLEYLSSGDFHYYYTGSVFAVKLREANFKNRSNIYLVTENNDYICTENGDRLII